MEYIWFDIWNISLRKTKIGSESGDLTGGASIWQATSANTMRADLGPNWLVLAAAASAALIGPLPAAAVSFASR